MHIEERRTTKCCGFRERKKYENETTKTKQTQHQRKTIRHPPGGYKFALYLRLINYGERTSTIPLALTELFSPWVLPATYCMQSSIEIIIISSFSISGWRPLPPKLNLVSGYECGRVFPAGVGPGSPSRDAADWLPSRFSLSVETRRQYGRLRMVFSGVRLFRAPIWWPSGGWRERQGALSSRRAW